MRKEDERNDQKGKKNLRSKRKKKGKIEKMVQKKEKSTS